MNALLFVPMKILIDVPDALFTKNIYKCDISLFHDIALRSFVRFAYLLQYLSPHSLASILDLFLQFP